jgi:hypothetical protein
MIVGGAITNLLVIWMMNGIFLGLSGVVASAIGIYFGFLIMNCGWLYQNYSQLFSAWIIMITFLILCLLNSSIKSTGVHFIALGVGICLSIGFMPYISENNWKNKVSMIFKFIVGILVVIPIVIILVH